MSGRTLVMMAIVLGLNWGGFIFCLWYGGHRAGRRGD
jgi:hypothetical protein